MGAVGAVPLPAHPLGGLTSSPGNSTMPGSIREYCSGALIDSPRTPVSAKGRSLRRALEGSPWPTDSDPDPPVQDLLVARNGCTSDEALMALTAAAQANELSVEELAEVLIADQDLR